MQADQFGDYVRHMRPWRVMRSSSGLIGRDAALVDGGGVHAGGVSIADLLIERAALLAHHGGALQNVEQDLFVVVAQFGEAAPARTVGRQRVVGNPVSAGVLVEIHAGVDGLVHGGRIQAGGSLRLRKRAARTEEGDQSKEESHSGYPYQEDLILAQRRDGTLDG